MVAEILDVKLREISNPGNNFFFYFPHFISQNPVANMQMATESYGKIEECKLSATMNEIHIHLPEMTKEGMIDANKLNNFKRSLRWVANLLGHF